MKNTIYIEIDSEKAEPILFGKGPDAVMPKNPQEAADMVLVDINCVTEALLSLIHLADQSGYGDQNVLLTETIAKLVNYQISLKK
jgi:hypothetical protein